MFAQIATRLLHALPPEAAHTATMKLLKSIPPTLLASLLASRTAPDPRLAVNTLGFKFPTPVGLAAGFDKDGDVWRHMLALGFGHAEVGTVTPLPQPGNPSPRVFRLREDKAVINRMGFPSGGQHAVLPRIRSRAAGEGILGLNIGKNKIQEDAAADYVAGLKTFAPHADYITINISSPNTPGLRDLQGKQALIDLLTAILTARQNVRPGLPLLLKVAPDLDDAAIADITEAVLTTEVSGGKINGLIVSNTTLARPDTLRGEDRVQTGGLSGAPLRQASTAILKRFRQETGGHMPLIGVGGITTAADAWEKITAGASLVQVYTGMIYAGPTIARDITDGLTHMINKVGLSSIEEAIGTDEEAPHV